MQLYSFQLVSPSITEVWIEWLWCVRWRNGMLMMMDVWLMLKIECLMWWSLLTVYLPFRLTQLECTHSELLERHLELQEKHSKLQNRHRSTEAEVSYMWCHTRCSVWCFWSACGTNIFLLEQFQLFKAKHADCDVTKVSTVCTSACVFASLHVIYICNGHAFHCYSIIRGWVSATHFHTSECMNEWSVLMTAVLSPQPQLQTHNSQWVAFLQPFFPWWSILVIYSCVFCFHLSRWVSYTWSSGVFIVTCLCFWPSSLLSLLLGLNWTKNRWVSRSTIGTAQHRNVFQWFMKQKTLVTKKWDTLKIQ